MTTYYNNLKITFANSNYFEYYCVGEDNVCEIQFNSLTHKLYVRSKYGFTEVDYSDANYKLFGELNENNIQKVELP